MVTGHHAPGIRDQKMGAAVILSVISRRQILTAAQR